MMTQIIVAFISTALAFAIIDLLWISRVALPYFFSKIEHLIAINIPAAVLFYLMYMSGIVYYAVYPALQSTSDGAWRQALVAGCFFGFFCYATYDLTNMATLKDWRWSLVVSDVLWGIVITGSTAVIGYLITKSIS